jgi:hypothetical protein
VREQVVGAQVARVTETAVEHDEHREHREADGRGEEPSTELADAIAVGLERW